MQEGIWGPGEQQIEEEPAACPCSNQGQPHQVALVRGSGAGQEKGEVGTQRCTAEREAMVTNCRQRNSSLRIKIFTTLDGAEKLCHLSWVEICLADDQNTTGKGSNLTQDLG